MVRFAGVKRNRIFLVSDKPCLGNDFEMVEVPAALDKISTADLITKCRVSSDGRFRCKLIHKPIGQLKIALVGNWKMQCGISSYSENLWPAIVPHVGDFKLFIEKNDGEATGDIHQIGNQIISDDKVSVCWQRGNSLKFLVEELKNYDPDVILIQHEFGLWSNARYWLSMMTELSDYRVIVVMHSIFPNHPDKMTYEASMPEIVVHLEAAKNNLVNVKKVNSKVHVIPHGCYPITDQKKLWDNYKSQHTFIQQGFGFTYKRFEDSIRATKILQAKYPDVFFTGLFSESPLNKAAHQMYFNELLLLTQELGLQENVALIRGFQSDNIVDAYLRSNQVAVFPYASITGHEVFGASGAARLAMASGIAVISSSIPHFSDLPTIKADTPEQIAEELDKLFQDDKLKRQQIDKQNQFIIDNSWANIAMKYVSIIEGQEKEIVDKS